MNILTLDAESFFSDNFTLSTLSTEAYIRDPRFEVHGWAVKLNDRNPVWWNHATAQIQFKKIDWSKFAVLHHHAQFDSFILNYCYDVRPAFIFDTLSMARLLLGNHVSVSLDSVRKHFNMPMKVTPYNLFKGKHWNELSPAVQNQVAQGAIDEVESIWKIFNLLAKDFPRSEYEMVDATIRMFTEPCIRADIDMLAKIWEDEACNKKDVLQELGIDEAEVQSANRFADLLRAEGIEPDTKEGKNGSIYAFAKKDDFMRQLLEHEDDRVRMLAEARVGAKSTLMQTRAETLGWMARRGPLPVYIKYAGAHTTRDAGGDGSNLTNLKRADPDNPKQASPLRRAILPPEGHLFAIADKSQIECRILNYVAGQWDVIEKFEKGEDPYVGIASQFYGRPITKDDKAERGTGKQLELSAGFGCGPRKCQLTAAAGTYGPPVYLTLEDATRAINLYRNTHPAICDKGTGYWAQAGRLIFRIADGEPYQWGPVLIKDGKLFGPGGTMLHYPNLHYHYPTAEEKEQLPEFKHGGYWRFKSRNGWSELYHTKLVENVIQWLARIAWAEDVIRIKRLGYKIVMRTYDEVVVPVKKDGNEQHHLDIIVNEMERSPAWMPDIPLEAEGFLSECYAK